MSAAPIPDGAKFVELRLPLDRTRAKIVLNVEAGTSRLMLSPCGGADGIAMRLGAAISMYSIGRIAGL